MFNEQQIQLFGSLTLQGWLNQSPTPIILLQHFKRIHKHKPLILINDVDVDMNPRVHESYTSRSCHYQIQGALRDFELFPLRLFYSSSSHLQYYDCYYCYYYFYFQYYYYHYHYDYYDGYYSYYQYIVFIYYEVGL